ncbi:MAG: hypothetical protein IBX53_10695 [Halomonas sp.]|uniref:hypothetical protein n=1 Tax=Halomonas sp. TaxID=1486246 RepID=UPI001A0889B9|nr:hypothetical protein [Halomonas sp.]MBE0489536.1 hypothetical protein [Halomonas sp.]
MPYTEAKEHAPGQLHGIFVDPYSAFDNMTTERLLHLRVAMQALIGRPLAGRQLILRVIHGWENGGCDPVELRHSDYPIATLEELRDIEALHRRALEELTPWPGTAGDLLAAPLAEAIRVAEAEGLTLDQQTRQTPSRWPGFRGGLWLYTLFKAYHRLTYGEDDSYRASRISLPAGERELHEFHLEEGEFAVITPADAASGEHLLVLHPSQLAPVLALLGETLTA